MIHPVSLCHPLSLCLFKHVFSVFFQITKLILTAFEFTCICIYIFCSSIIALVVTNCLSLWEMWTNAAFKSHPADCNYKGGREKNCMSASRDYKYRILVFSDSYDIFHLVKRTTKLSTNIANKISILTTVHYFFVTLVRGSHRNISNIRCIALKFMMLTPWVFLCFEWTADIYVLVTKLDPLSG